MRFTRTLGGHLVLLAVTAAACRSNSTPPVAAPSADPAAWGGLQVAMVQPPNAPAVGGRVVVLLHGWGAPGDDLVPLAQALLEPGTRFVVPTAPLAHPAGGGGRAWWHLDLERRRRAQPGDPQLEEVPEGLPAARTQVQRLLRDVRQRLRPAVLTLAGFSQGGMLALDVALAADPPVDRVVVLSGTLIAAEVWRKHMAQPGAKPPVFVSHGRHDVVLPFAVAEHLRQLLEQHAFPITFVPFEGGHEIPESLFGALRTFYRSDRW